MPTLPLKVSGRVLIRDSADQVLVLCRSAKAKSNAGKWEFPGGKTDPGEAIDVALLRETLEETGLEIELGAWVGATEFPMPQRGIRVVFLFFEGRVVGGSVQLSPEHDAFRWAPRRSVPELDLCAEFRPMAETYSGHSG